MKSVEAVQFNEKIRAHVLGSHVAEGETVRHVLCNQALEH
jgi:hypothetical protein